MPRPQPTQRGLGKTRLPVDIPKHCTKELLAAARRHTLADDLIEMKCLYNASGTPSRYTDTSQCLPSWKSGRNQFPAAVCQAPCGVTATRFDIGTALENVGAHIDA